MGEAVPALTPLHVAASRGCRRCLQLLLRKRGDPQLPGQDGNRGGDLAPEQGTRAPCWLPAEEPGGARHSLSFLTEDGTDGRGSSGPLSSTRRSLLEELELGGSGGSGDPLLCRGCPPAPSIPSSSPWPHTDPWGSALPPHPLASSTLLSARDKLEGGPRSPPRAVPKSSSGDNPSPSPQWDSGGCLSSPQPQGCGRVLGEQGVTPGAPHLPCGLSGCSVARWHPRDGDILGAAAQHRPGVPRGPARGWAGLGIVPPAAPTPGVLVLGMGDRVGDSSSPGDSSSATELFVSALETLEPSEAGGCLGAQHHCSPQPKAAGGPEPGKAPTLTGAGAWELPPTSPPNTGQVQGEDFGGSSRAAPGRKDGSEVGSVGELLGLLQGCSLQDCPPCTPGALCNPASLTAGDVTPQGQEPPRYHHVTPRTKSRLQGCAERFRDSSSSLFSLFDETLEACRPPRLRAPRGVPRVPATTLGHRVTPRDEDVSSRDREGTSSLDDTEILPGAPGQPRSPPGTSSSPGSSPTVLLVPGDHGHPQDSPSDTRGSPGSSPTVLLVPGHPQHSPVQGSPCAAGSPNPRGLGGGSGWQDPSSSGTHQPHGSCSRLLAPWPPGSTVVEPGGSAVPLSPPGCSTPLTGEHREEQGPAPPDRHGPGTEATPRGRAACPVPPRPLSDEGLRRRLRALGDDPGPVTELTRRLYLRRLRELARAPRGNPPGEARGSPTRPGPRGAVGAPRCPGHSPELAAAMSTGRVPDCARDELVLAQQFERPERGRRWPEGLAKSSFNYLLLDPRTTQNLPLRCHRLSPAECFRIFVQGIFYVGKGTRARPYRHLTEALSQHRAGTQRGCPKVRRILEIWASGQGVISVHCFQSSLPAEAYTREGCLLEALGLQTLTNQRRGHCYGTVASWPAERRRLLGVHMLHRAMNIFLAEGERQLRPGDIQGGR